MAELFSQPRIVQEAAVRDYDGLKLLPGWSLDLTREDPATGQAWDLSKHAVRERVRKLVRTTKPFLLIGSPPCTAFSSLQNLSKNKRDPKVVKEEKAVAVQHLTFCMELYKMQIGSRRFFLHEIQEQQLHGTRRRSWRC